MRRGNDLHIAMQCATASKVCTDPAARDNGWRIAPRHHGQIHALGHLLQGRRQLRRRRGLLATRAAARDRARARRDALARRSRAARAHRPAESIRRATAQRATGVTIRRWARDRSRQPARRRRRRGVRLRAPRALRRRDGRSERSRRCGSSSNTCPPRTWVEQRARPSLAASAAAADAPLLVSGFTPQTGGLLARARSRRRTRRGFGATTRRQRAVLVVARDAADRARTKSACRSSVIRTRALPALLDAWADGDAPVTCVVPEGVAIGALDAWTGGNAAAPRRAARARPPRRPRDSVPRAGRLRPAAVAVRRVNFVRGEDSFVRAQWAGRPLRLAHLPAGGKRALAKSSTRSSIATRQGSRRPPRRRCGRFWQLWNGRGTRRRRRRIGAAWREFAAARAALDRHAVAWTADLAALPDSGRRAGQGGRGSGIIKGFPNQPLIAYSGTTMKTPRKYAPAT